MLLLAKKCILIVPMVCLTYASGCVAQDKAALPTCLFVFALITNQLLGSISYSLIFES